MRTGSFLFLLMLTGAGASADQSVSRVRVSAERIEVSEPIFFDAGKASIKAVSLPLLNEVAEAIGRNPRLSLVEVGVHSDERGADAYNLRITDERAAAIKAYLVQRGVDAGRLQSRGYGETRPLCTEHNEACWSRNRRTEFVIVSTSPAK